VGKLDALLQGVRSVKDVAVLAAQVEGLTRKACASWSTPCGRRWDRAYLCWRRWRTGGWPAFERHPDLTDRLHADKIIQSVAKDLGDKGRAPRFGRGWRKRHIQPKKCPGPGLPLVEGMLSSR